MTNPIPTDKIFERWWNLQQQKIGKKLAKAAWDYQQVKINSLMDKVRELQISEEARKMNIVITKAEP